MQKLIRLGWKYGTDKQRHKFAGEGYMTVYHKYFSPVHDTVKHVLELGVLDGGSLKTWRDYFPNAEIWGVDINPDVPKEHGPRVHVIVGSQTDPAALNQVAPSQMLDIVIDDGSHVVDHMIESFRLLWPRVASGGLYVMEDMENIYADISKSKAGWPGQAHNAADTNYQNEHEKLDALFAAKTKDLDQGKGDMRFLHRWHQQAFLCKV